MCYSGRCMFEDYMGGCKAGAYYTMYKHLKKPAYSVCILGESAHYPEEEEFIEQAKHNLVFQYAQRKLQNKLSAHYCIF